MDPLTRLLIETFGMPETLSPAPPAQSAVIPLNFYETRGEMIIELSLAGYAREDVTAKINGHIVHITAVPRIYEGFQESKVFSHNFAHVGLSRDLELPDYLDSTNVQVSMADGLLRIKVPRRPEVVQSLDIESHHDQYMVDYDGA